MTAVHITASNSSDNLPNMGVHPVRRKPKVWFESIMSVKNSSIIKN